MQSRPLTPLSLFNNCGGTGSVLGVRVAQQQPEAGALLPEPGHSVLISKGLRLLYKPVFSWSVCRGISMVIAKR